MLQTHRSLSDCLQKSKLMALAAILLAQVYFFDFYAQTKDPFGIKLMSQHEKPQTRNLFETIKPSATAHHSENSAIQASINRQVLLKIQQKFTPVITMPIPLGVSRQIKYNFVEYNFYTEDFTVYAIDDQVTKPINVSTGIHLKGVPADGSAGFSCLSLFENEVYGSFTMETGEFYSLTPIYSEISESIKCAITDEHRVNWSDVSTGCHTDDIRDYVGSEASLQLRSNDQCKRVEISVNVDYDLYLKFNKNPQAVVNYVSGLFNNVHSLYKNEGISIALAQILIHSSEDNFSHISASSDLENFRKKYPNTQKTVKLLLSGYSKNNIAPLGGISYINTVCNNSYSYAYGNVLGNYTQSPAYSWDVFVVTHELGHIFGSRHTHACAWGPNKNQAIDNCAKLEGSCSSPGIPKKGTLMSYCYQSNMPGIDFSLGFGSEPGALIRKTIQNAACLKSSAPDGISLDTSHTTITANAECSDGIYTHYYFDNNTVDVKDDILLLSIKKDSNLLGSLRDSSLFIQLTTTSDYGSGKGTPITAGYVQKDQSFHVINKYWTIKNSTPINKPLQIQYILTAKDVEDLTGSINTFQTQELMCFQILKPASIDPRTNHAQATTEKFKSYTNSATPGINKFILIKQANGTYFVELQTTSLENTGFGVAKTNTSPFINYSGLKATSQTTVTNIEFQTTYENNCKLFVIEKSKNGQVYDSIGQVTSKGSGQQLTNYSLMVATSTAESEFLRIKAVSGTGQSLYSSPFQALQIQAPEEALKLYPNPVTQGKLSFDYILKSNAAEKITVSILDVYGKTLRAYSYYAYPGKNTYSIYTYGLKNSLHYLRITSKAESVKASFSIGQ